MMYLILGLLLCFSNMCAMHPDDEKVIRHIALIQSKEEAKRYLQQVEQVLYNVDSTINWALMIKALDLDMEAEVYGLCHQVSGKSYVSRVQIEEKRCHAHDLLIGYNAGHFRKLYRRLMGGHKICCREVNEEQRVDFGYKNVLRELLPTGQEYALNLTLRTMKKSQKEALGIKTSFRRILLTIKSFCV